MAGERLWATGLPITQYRSAGWLMMDDGKNETEGGAGGTYPSHAAVTTTKSGRVLDGFRSAAGA